MTYWRAIVPIRKFVRRGRELVDLNVPGPTIASHANTSKRIRCTRVTVGSASYVDQPRPIVLHCRRNVLLLVLLGVLVLSVSEVAIVACQ